MDVKTLQYLITNHHPVKTPRYLETKVQECALSHLNLQDMGKLRDRMEGQHYYSSLKRDLLATYAFEKSILQQEYDWESRMAKNGVITSYEVEGFKISIVAYDSKSIIKFNNTLDNSNFVIFGYIHPNSKVYLSGVHKYSNIQTNLSCDENIRSKDVIELLSRIEKEDCRFNSREELVNILNKG